MNRVRALWVVVLAAAGFAATGVLAADVAVAQEAEAPAPAGGGDSGGAEATTYDFEDDIVDGDLVRPDGELLNVRRRGQRSSLIRVKEHFINEMLKSVEDL